MVFILEVLSSYDALENNCWRETASESDRVHCDIDMLLRASKISPDSN